PFAFCLDDPANVVEFAKKSAIRLQSVAYLAQGPFNRLVKFSHLSTNELAGDPGSDVAESESLRQFRLKLHAGTGVVNQVHHETPPHGPNRQGETRGGDEDRHAQMP